MTKGGRMNNQELLEILKRRCLIGLYITEEIPKPREVKDKKVNDLLDQAVFHLEEVEAIQDQLLEYLE